MFFSHLTDKIAIDAATQMCDVFLFVIQFLKRAGLADEDIVTGLLEGIEEAVSNHKKDNPDYDSTELINALKIIYPDSLAQSVKEAYSK